MKKKAKAMRESILSMGKVSRSTKTTVPGGTFFDEDQYLSPSGVTLFMPILGVRRFILDGHIAKFVGQHFFPGCVVY